MNKINDIRPLKTKLRQKIKLIRTTMPPEEKQRLDSKITNKFINMWQYREAETIFTYVSTDIEVSTKQIIERAVSDGKTVAVPRCVDGTREMEFYVIDGYHSLETGSFGVLEPITQKCRKIEDFSKGVCIVPALSFDRSGYRLGYGKGYYDRFLSKFCGETLGICYNSCVTDNLPHGKYDRAVQKIITESSVIITDIQKGGKPDER